MENIDILENLGCSIYAGEQDSFGWLNGCIGKQSKWGDCLWLKIFEKELAIIKENKILYGHLVKNKYLDEMTVFILGVGVEANGAISGHILHIPQHHMW